MLLRRLLGGAARRRPGLPSAVAVFAALSMALLLPPTPAQAQPDPAPAPASAPAAAGAASAPVQDGRPADVPWSDEGYTRVLSWKLQATQLQQLVREMAGAAPGAELPPRAAELLARLQALLAGVAEVDFPTRELLDKALPALPPELPRERLLALAERRHSLLRAAPVRWSGGGCGCTPAELRRRDGTFTYALLPFWQPAPGQAMTVDFSAFSRLGYLGAVLHEDGSVEAAPHWNDGAPDGPRAALRHGTALDLVVWGRSLAPWLAQPREQRTRGVNLAARALAAMLDAPLQGPAEGLLRALQWPWPQPQHLYGGVTLFFADVPAGDAARVLLAEFATALAEELKGRKRPLALNVVVPASMLESLSLGTSLEPLRQQLTLVDGSVPARALVLLPPGADSRKQLRLKLDQDEALNGRLGAEVLKRLVPVVLFAAGDDPPPAPAGGASAAEGAAPPPPKPLPMAPEVARRFGQDLDYHAWNFGGAALWPLPSASAGSADDAQRLLLQSFRDQEHWWTGRSELRQALCDTLCPWRTAARVAFNLGLLGLLGATAAYFFSARRHALGWRYLSRLLAVGVALAALFLALLNCDPDLEALRQSGLLPLALLGGVGLWVVWLLLRKPVPVP